MAALTTSTLSFGSREALIVPLTTVFTRPASCSPAPEIIPQASTDGPDSPCYPPQWHSVDWKEGFYSPGLCPEGFSIGCSAWGSEWKTQAEEGWYDVHAVRTDETAYICVPGGFTCTGYGQASKIIRGRRTVFGAAMEIRWREQDIFLLETHPLTPGLRPTPTDTATGKDITPSLSSVSSHASTKGGVSVTQITPAGSAADPPRETGTPDTSTTNGRTSTGLSKNARIGIGIGVGCGILALLLLSLLVWYIYRHRRSPNQPLPELEASTRTVGPSKPEESQLSSDVAPKLSVPDFKISHKLLLPPILPLSSASLGSEPVTSWQKFTSDTSPAPEINQRSSGRADSMTLGASGARSSRELIELKMRQSEIQSKKRALMELAKLEAEEEMIQKRLDSLEVNSV